MPPMSATAAAAGSQRAQLQLHSRRQSAAGNVTMAAGRVTVWPPTMPRNTSTSIKCSRAASSARAAIQLRRIHRLAVGKGFNNINDVVHDTPLSDPDEPDEESPPNRTGRSRCTAIGPASDSRSSVARA